MKFSRCIITVNIFPSNEATLIPKTVSFFCVTKEDSHIPSRMLYSLDAVTKTLKLNIFSKFLLKAHFFFLIIVIKKSKKKGEIRNKKLITSCRFKTVKTMIVAIVQNYQYRTTLLLMNRHSIDMQWFHAF